MKLSTKLKKLKEGDIIVIRWFDAWRNAEASARGDEITEARMELLDVGFYLTDVDGYIVIAEESCESPRDFRHLHHIPKVNIVDVEVLKSYGD